MTDEKLLQKLNKKKRIVGECWLWGGAQTSSGYGAITIWGQKKLVHRIAAYLYLDLDMDNKDIYVCHKCSSKLCFNPEHIYLGDNGTNVKDRRFVLGYVNPKKFATHCKRGHEYNVVGFNVYKGSRNCKQCKLDLQRERRRDRNTNNGRSGNACQTS